MVQMVPNIEMVRMVNSGTEAVMSALRLARGATGRDKLMKFEGCYHGHSDSMLVKAGSSAVAEEGRPSSAGVPADVAKDTLTARYNDLESVRELFARYPGQIACVIVEPVAANMGVVGPQPGFLEGLRAICDKEGALLLFDEVNQPGSVWRAAARRSFSAVRARSRGRSARLSAAVCLWARTAEAARSWAGGPVRPRIPGGTLSGNPVAMAAGLAQLDVSQRASRGV